MTNYSEMRIDDKKYLNTYYITNFYLIVYILEKIF